MGMASRRITVVTWVCEVLKDREGMEQDEAPFKLRIGAGGLTSMGRHSWDWPMATPAVNFIESTFDVAANEQPIVTPL